MATPETKLPEWIEKLTHEEVVAKMKVALADRARLRRAASEQTTLHQLLKERLVRLAILNDPLDFPLTAPVVDAAPDISQGVRDAVTNTRKPPVIVDTGASAVFGNDDPDFVEPGEGDS